MKRFDEEALERIVKQTLRKKHIHGAVFHVSTGDGRKSLSGAAGDMDVESSYYIASINKMMVSAVTLKLIEEGKLHFTDTLEKFMDPSQLEGLHVLGGKDHSKDIRVVHLLSNTSGLPCYFEDQPIEGNSVMKELEAGIDQPWPLEKVIERVKTMKPHFNPGEANRAKYIDTNHQLLNLVIEKVLDTPVKDVLNQLFSDLEMQRTYVCEDVHDTSYVYPYYKDEKRNISKFITSTQNDVISTAKDQMIFLKAFFNGYFYSKEKIEDLKKWKPIFFPFQYGIGIQKFFMPRILSPLKAVPDMIGHCGSTGSVAFYVPDADLYITGTTNQQANPSAAFQTLIKIVHTVL